MDFKVSTPRLSQRQLQNRFAFSPFHSDSYSSLNTMTLSPNFKCGPLRPQFILRWCVNCRTAFTCLVAANQLTFVHQYKISQILIDISSRNRRFLFCIPLNTQFVLDYKQKRWKTRVTFVTLVLNKQNLKDQMP